MDLADYHSTSNMLFGETMRRDLRNVKLHSIYPSDSKYFKQCHLALLEVEHEYIEELLTDMKQRNVNGSLAEFGIYQGAWINRLYEMTERIGWSDRDIYGFDSFKGLSTPNPEKDTTFWKEGMYSAGRREVENNVQAHVRSRIHLVEGFFSESLLSAEAQEVGQIAFARIDCDIYEPACQCLGYLSNRLSHGSMLVFDDWTHDFERGEARAFAEWAPTVPRLEFEFLFMGPWDHLHLRVLHK